MTRSDIIVLLPYIILAASSVVVMLVIAVRRSYQLTVLLTLAGISLALASFPALSPLLPRQVTALLVIDRYAVLFSTLVLLAGLAVAVLSGPYFSRRSAPREEFYVLLLIATLGAAILAASTHFASLFLGIETLTVSLYAMIAYLRDSDRGLEAGMKYLLLAAVSSAFLLFGMALVYAATGSMEFSRIAARAGDAPALTLQAGLGLIIAGLGFKLAVVPFHLWTPDVYEGAPAPVTAFIATVSKSAVVAVLLRSFGTLGISQEGPLFLVVTGIAVASMLLGNVLALLQDNIKRLLAYSSIAHFGYLLVMLAAGGSTAAVAATFYLAAYVITTLGAFGVVTVLSGPEGDAAARDDYQGLAWRRPWLAAVFAAMLLSLAGLPLTAGFVGKFTLVLAAIGSALWVPVAALVLGSVIGLFYYLRIIALLFAGPGRGIPLPPSLSFLSGSVLAVLLVLLLLLGVYPAPLLDLIVHAVR
jgi:NADH-quinone oxidoreductase subunit N